MPRHATRTSFQSGDRHPQWKGGIANFNALASSTQEVYSRKEARGIMGYPKGIVHHKDGNVRNRSKGNLQALLNQREHMKIHHAISPRTGIHNKHSLQVTFKDTVLAINEPSRKVAKNLGISKNTVLRIRRRYA